jgi:anti-sigma regulatory factor (Ser/Thr protein kinase)
MITSFGHSFGGCVGLPAYERREFEVNVRLIGGTMPLAASAGEWTRVRFSSDLSSEAVDTQLARLDQARWRSPLNLDLSETTSVDITALLRILALVNDRGNEDQETIISAPRSPEVRRRLEDWDFPTTAAMVCGSPFRQLVWERPPHPTRHWSRTDHKAPFWHDDRYSKIVDDGLFGFMTYVFETDIQASSVIDTEWARWRSPLVLSMFEARLGAQSLEIARVVIYELLANAVQHTHANLVVVASHATGLASRHRGSRRQAEELTISVWDNGDGITQSLRGRTDSDGPLHGNALMPNDTFLVESIGWTSTADRYRAGWKPELDAPDEEVLISSLFPSRSPEADFSGRRQRTPVVEAAQPRQGFGFHALYRCVVNLFNGTLEIRTGRQILTLGVAPRRNKQRFYHTRLQRFAGRSFRGNMLTVRIPLTHGR